MTINTGLCRNTANRHSTLANRLCLLFRQTGKIDNYPDISPKGESESGSRLFLRSFPSSLASPRGADWLERVNIAR